jgi:hypothetical protein
MRTDQQRNHRVESGTPQLVTTLGVSGPKKENSNRQLRFWFPKDTNLAIHTQATFDNACAVLNGQPRYQYQDQTVLERSTLNQACIDH